MFLVGFMASGKSTVGRELARRLGWEFVDLDTRIESRERQGIPEIFRDRGEPGFRAAETLALAELTQARVGLVGHALECRLYAENPAKMFLPSPGKLVKFQLPDASDGVRVDTGVREGDTITPYYDPLLAKIICHAPTRAAALAKMALALAATQVEGIWTNVEFLRRIIAHPAFERGEVFTGFIDAHKADLLA